MAEAKKCWLCGGEHEPIGTFGGVPITTCERVKDFGRVMGVAISPEIERLFDASESDIAQHLTLIANDESHSAADVAPYEATHE
jgi:hypothetical protein